MASEWLIIEYFLVLLTSFVYSQCVIQNKKLLCNDVSELPRDFADLRNLEDIEEMMVDGSSSGKTKEKLLVQDNAFRSLPNLKVLWIQNSSMKSLHQETFRNLAAIELFLYNDDIDKIAYGTFSNLTKVRKIHLDHNLLKTIVRDEIRNLPELVELTISNNQIAYVDNAAFGNIPKLENLELNNNKIDTIYVHQILNYPESLKSLSLQHNSLTVLTKFMLKGLTNLRILNVGFNKILAIEPNSFEDMQTLHTLMLNHNSVKKLDGVVFPKRGLNKIYLDNNNLIYLPTTFFEDLKDLRKITLVGNPWLCGCWDAIQWFMQQNKVEEQCRGVYRNGERPVCVLESTRTPICFYRYEFELNEKFEEYKLNYPLKEPHENCVL